MSNVELNFAGVQYLELLNRSYHLTSLTLHGQGTSPRSGQYVAIARHGNPSSWFLYNDDFRVQIDEADIACRFQHASLSGTFRANVLFYEASEPSR